MPSATTRPAVEDHDAVAEPLGLLDVVGDQHDGRAPVADPADDVPGVAAADRVEVLGELVEEHEPGPADQGQGHEQPLALAAGQGGEGPAPQVAQLPLLGQLVERPGARVQRREQPSASPHPHAVGEGGVLELGADPPAQPVAGRAGSRPSTDTSPLSARRRPWRISTVVVLPAPLVPSRPNSSPRRTAKETPLQHLGGPVAPSEVAHLDEVIDGGTVGRRRARPGGCWWSWPDRALHARRAHRPTVATWAPPRGGSTIPWS